MKLAFESKTKNLLIAAILFSLIGCTRPKEDSSQISIVLPKNISPSNKLSAQSVNVLAHLVVNVTASDMPPIYISKDSCNSGNCAAAGLSNQFTVEIPKGSDRSFQVLAVYQDSVTTGMTFYYGDTVKTLSNSDETVAISLTNVGISNSYGGSISGRYIDSTGFIQGPTGVVFMKYNPPNNKPPMVIDRESIVNGWFNFFGLNNVKFTYVLENGRVLFDGPMALNDFPLNQQVAKIWIPVSQRNEGGGSPNWKPQEASQNVVGWFSDAANASLIAGKFASRGSGDANISVMTKTARFTNNATLLSPNTSPPATATLDALLMDSTASCSNVYYVSGGSTSAVAAADQFDIHIPVKPAFIDTNGKDSVAGFKGLFKLVESGGYYSKFKTKYISGGTVKMDVELLPGVVSTPVISVFNQIHFFKFVGSGPSQLKLEDGGGGSSPMCPEIAAGAFGAYQNLINDIGSTVVTYNSGASVTLDTGVTSADATAQVQVAGCFGKNGTVYGRPGVVRSDEFGQFASGSIDHLELIFRDQKYEAFMDNANPCRKVEVHLKDQNGFSVSSMAALNFTIEESTDGGTSWAAKALKGSGDSTCVSGDAGLNLPASTSQQTFYMSSSGTTVKYRLASPQVSQNWVSPNISLMASSNNVLKLNLPSSVFPGLCYPAELKNDQIGGALGSLSSSFSVSSSSGTAGVYTDSGCTTPVTTISGSSQIVYFKITGLPANSSPVIITLSNIATNKDQNTILVDQGSPTVTGIELEGPTNMVGGSCHVLKAKAVGGLKNTPIPVGASPISINIAGSGSFSNGRFYANDPTCTNSSLASPLGTSIAINQYEVKFGFKPFDMNGAASPQLIATSASGNSTLNINTYAGMNPTPAAPGAWNSPSACKGLTLQMQNTSGLVNATTSDGWMLDIPNSTVSGCSGGIFVGFYSDSNCSSAISGLVPMASPSNNIFLKTDNAGTTCNLSLKTNLFAPFISVPGFTFGP